MVTLGQGIMALQGFAGRWQVAYLEMLKKKGLQLYAAYGNTTTDIRAYSAAGIPKVCSHPEEMCMQ